MSRVAEFTPCLLQIVLDNVDLAVRQAGESMCMVCVHVRYLQTCTYVDLLFSMSEFLGASSSLYICSHKPKFEILFTNADIQSNQTPLHSKTVSTYLLVVTPYFQTGK